MQVLCGTLVVVRAGKYKGFIMAVTRVDESFIYVSDGRHRKQEHAKRYNPKHLKVLDMKIGESEFSSLTNKMLWRKIQQMSVDIQMD